MGRFPHLPVPGCVAATRIVYDRSVPFPEKSLVPRNGQGSFPRVPIDVMLRGTANNKQATNAFQIAKRRSVALKTSFGPARIRLTIDKLRNSK
jgi:hypothetical protein